MTPEQFVAILGAFTALLGAIGALWVAVHRVHVQINSRMDQLLALTQTSARAEGVIEGKDQAALTEAPPVTPHARRS